MSIQTKIQAFKEDLDFFEDELQKYEFIIDLGKKLKPFDEKLQIDKNLVQGCTSQVWLVCEKKRISSIFTEPPMLLLSKVWSI